MHSKDFLAQELRKAGLNDMAKRAEAGLYHDYLSPLDTPSIQLAKDLERAIAGGNIAANDLRRRHFDGEFDATAEESEAWAASSEGQAAFEKLMPEHRLGDAPLEEERATQMQAVAETLNEFFNGTQKPRPVGFVLMVFPFAGFDGRCNYISNGADRKDVVTLMKEMIARFEGQPEAAGHG